MSGRMWYKLPVVFLTFLTTVLYAQKINDASQMEAEKIKENLVSLIIDGSLWQWIMSNMVIISAFSYVSHSLYITGEGVNDIFLCPRNNKLQTDQKQDRELITVSIDLRSLHYYASLAAYPSLVCKYFNSNYCIQM